jgi:rhodanese-related sulfurtransferase
MRVAALSTVVLGILLLGAGQTEIPDAPVSFIEADELKALLDKGTKVDIIDVRRRDVYLEQHIKGARNIPLSEIGLPGGTAGIPKRGPVVFY